MVHPGYYNIKRPYSFSAGSFVGGVLVGAGLVGITIALASAYEKPRHVEYKIKS